MIFADKLITLRKKAGMTQEDLADKMDVTRQAIAKWESLQSIPELSKIVKLAEIFEVSTDFLLKDSIEIEDYIDSDNNQSKNKCVSLDDANKFLDLKSKASLPMAVAVLLCIISPIALIILSSLTQIPQYNISENLAVGLGMAILIVFVATAVAIFIILDNKSSNYKYFNNDCLDLQYGIEGMVKEKQNKYKPIYNSFNLVGVVLCILSVTLIFIALIIDRNNALLFACMVCGMIAMVGVGVFLIVKVGVIWSSYQKILQDGEYTKDRKNEKKTIVGAVSSVYWLMTTAIYLVYSFATNSWQISWIIWVISAVLYPIIIALLRTLNNKK